RHPHPILHTSPSLLSITRPPPISTLFPYTTLFRSWSVGAHARERDVRRFDDREIVGETRVRRAGGWLGLERRRLAPDLVASVSLIGEDVEVEDGARGLAAGAVVRLGPL